MLTLREHVEEAIKHLEQAIDTFPDKTDDIRRDNALIYATIDLLKAIND